MLFGKIPLPDWFLNFYSENKRGFFLLYILIGLLLINFFVFPVKKKNPQEQNLNPAQQQTTTPSQQTTTDNSSTNNNQQLATNTTSQTNLQNNQNQTAPQPLTQEASTKTTTTTTTEANKTSANTNTATGVLTTNTASKMKASLVEEDEGGKIDPYRPLIVTESTTAQQTTAKVKTPIIKNIKKIKVKPPKYNGYLPPLEIPTPGTIPTPVVVEVKKPATIKVSGVAIDSQPTAIISDGNKDYIVKEGGNVAGYKVVSISSKKIILIKKGKRKELKVGG